MSSAPSPSDSISHPPSSGTPPSDNAPTPAYTNSSPLIPPHTSNAPASAMNGHEHAAPTNTNDNPLANGHRKTTRPSTSIQFNADKLVELFATEKAKITHLYQNNLGVLEAQFNDYKAKSQAEIASMGQKEALHVQRIDALEKELDAKSSELERLKSALQAANLVYANGKLKPGS